MKKTDKIVSAARLYSRTWYYFDTVFLQNPASENHGLTFGRTFQGFCAKCIYRWLSNIYSFTTFIIGIKTKKNSCFRLQYWLFCRLTLTISSAHLDYFGFSLWLVDISTGSFWMQKRIKRCIESDFLAEKKWFHGCFWRARKYQQYAAMALSRH